VKLSRFPKPAVCMIDTNVGQREYRRRLLNVPTRDGFVIIPEQALSLDHIRQRPIGWSSISAVLVLVVPFTSVKP